jgi:hypothetical protein
MTHETEGKQLAVITLVQADHPDRRIKYRAVVSGLHIPQIHTFFGTTAAEAMHNAANLAVAKLEISAK